MKGLGIIDCLNGSEIEVEEEGKKEWCGVMWMRKTREEEKVMLSWCLNSRKGTRTHGGQRKSKGNQAYRNQCVYTHK